MSMNLNCNLVDLLQTPTSVTKMCVATPDGYTMEDLTGYEAQRALQAYISWVQGRLDGLWNSTEELEAEEVFVKEHVDKVKSVLGDPSLIVYMA